MTITDFNLYELVQEILPTITDEGYHAENIMLHPNVQSFINEINPHVMDIVSVILGDESNMLSLRVMVSRHVKLPTTITRVSCGFTSNDLDKDINYEVNSDSAISVISKIHFFINLCLSHNGFSKRKLD